MSKSNSTRSLEMSALPVQARAGGRRPRIRLRAGLAWAIVVFVCLLAFAEFSAAAPADGTGAVAIFPSDRSAAHALRNAWTQAAESGSYRFDTHIRQTVYPVPSLGNVGAAPWTDELYLAGMRDQAADRLELTVWQHARGQVEEGISLRVEDGLTYRRTLDGKWEVQSSVDELFAPGGDPLIFLETAKNVVSLGQERRQIGPLAIDFEKYRFDLDTNAYAQAMAAHLDAQLAQYGPKPQNLSLQIPDVIRRTTGQGIFWLDESGRPARVELSLEMPPQEGQGRTIAWIVIDFSAFSAGAVSAESVLRLPFPLLGETLRQIVSFLLITAFLLYVAVRYRRRRQLYTAVVVAVIVSMVCTPLLDSVQAKSFFVSIDAARAEANGQRAADEEVTAFQDKARANDWNPHLHPRESAALSSPALTVTVAEADATDSDGDGLLDVDEAEWRTCAYAGAAENCTGVANSADTDGDGLGDGLEVHELGTNPALADTDSDGISDADEISGFSYAGQTWYLNPRESDTNKDGLIDGLECRARTQTIPAEYSATAVCPDTDGDNLPDVFDDDNDNDGVPDRNDLSPFSAGSDFYGENNPLQLSISNLALDKPVFVDFQFRPEQASNLNLYHHVLDWPSQDGEGQIQRVLDTTWADTSNLDLRSNAVNAGNGDIRLVPMLEITMPYANGHYANLPITTTAPVDRVLGVSVDEWVDTTQLAPQGIEVSEQDASTGLLSAYLPLNQVKDRFGTPQAFHARMLYRPSQGADGRADWGPAQEVRLVWLVQIITDQCPSGYEDERKENNGEIEYRCVDPDSGDTASREEVLTIGHIYPETWRLTGLSVSEEHDFDMAILYEDPAQDADLTADDQLLVASWNLSTGFMIGRDCDSKDGNGNCVGNGSRDVTVENLAGNVASWFTESYYISVESYLDYEHGAYLAYLIGTEVQPLLDTHFAAHTDMIPTFMYVQDHTSREVNLDNLTQNSAAGLITFAGTGLGVDLSPADVPVQVKSSVSWTPYQYVNGAWRAADIDAYLTGLDTRLQQDEYFQPEDESTAAAQETGDRRLWVQTYYASLWMGLSAWTQLDGQPLNARDVNTNIPDAVYDPFFTPGTDFGAAKVAMTFFDIVGNFLVNPSLSRISWTGVLGFTVLTLVIWGAIALMALGDATGNQQLRRTGEIILASITLVIGTLTVINALIAISNGGLAAGVAYKAIGTIGVLLILAVTWGLFLLNVFTTDMSTIAINVALSVTIATTLVLLMLVALSTVGLGFIGILLIMVDAIFVLLNKKGPTQYVTEFLATRLFDVDLSVTNLDAGDRLDIELLNLEFMDERQGFRETNSLLVTMGITNTIKYHRDLADDEERVARRNVFTYTLQTGHATFERDLDYWANTETDQWTPLSGRKLQTDYENSVTVALSTVGTGVQVGAGVNQPIELNYTESFLSGAQTCWRIPTDMGVVETFCNWKKFRDAIHYPLFSMLIYDIFPETVAEFARMDWSRNSDPPLPRQVDLDADGISDWFGTDPGFAEDFSYDTDQDGLGDGYELANGTNPTVPDTDFDGIDDRQEMFIGTNPLLRDTDGDGLSDGTEAVDGWFFVYGNGQTARVWSDPFAVDTDGDGLNDLEELVFGFNPWTATDPSLITQLVQFDNLGVNEQGAPELLLQFEDGTTSTAFYDSSGTGRHAICSGDDCPLVTDSGRYGQAVHFDGTNDYLRTPFVLNPAQTAFTAALWVKADSVSSQPILLQQLDQNGSGRTWLGLNGDGTLTTFLGGSSLSGTTPIGLNTWRYVAVTYDGATLRLYLDGTLEAEAARGMEASEGAMWLGQLKTGGRFLDGSLDDVVVLDQALDAGGIIDLMNGRFDPNDNLLRPGSQLSYQATITNTSAVTATGFLVADSTYVWPEVAHPTAAFGFQQSERLAYFANQGQGDNTSIICVDSGTCPAFNVAGKYDEGLGFYSPQFDYALLPSLGRKETADPIFNLSFWMRVDQFPPAGQVAMILDTESDENGALDVYIDSAGKLYWSVVGDPDSPRMSSSTLGQSQQTHISIDNLNNLYVNGNLDVSGTYSYGSLDRLLVGPGTLGNSVDFSQPYFGAIDELVYFSYGQSNSINAIKNGTYNNAEMIYRFSSATISLGYDNRANDLRSLTCPSLAECPSHTGGKYGHGVAFDGVDDYLEWDNVLNPTVTPLTAAVWFKATDFSNQPNLLQQTDDTGTGRTWLGIRTDGHLYSFLGGSYLIGTTPVQTGVWHHAAVTYDGTTLRLYLDGTEDASSVRALEANDSNVLVGRSKPSLAPNFYNGSLDELFVTPQVLSPEAVQAVMHSSWPMVDVAAPFVPYSAGALSSLAVSGDAPVSSYAVSSQHRFEQEVEAALELQAEIAYPLVDPYASDLELFIPFEDGPGSTSAENYIEYPSPLNFDPDMDANCLSLDACPTFGLRGQADRAAYFDGRDDFLYVPQVPQTYGIYPINTIAAWINAEAGTILELFRFNSTWTLTLEGLDMSGNSLTSDPKSMNFDLPRKEWFHLVLTIDADRIIHVYVNGVEIASGSGTLPNFTASSGSGIEVYLGGNSRGQNYLEGYLDDLRIYSVPFDATDAANLYAISAPLLRFEFDEDESATLFRDNSVGQYVGRPSQVAAQVDGETVTQPSPAPGTKGRIGNGALFNGQGYIEVNDATTPSALTNDFTFMAWIRPQSVGTSIERLFGAGNAASVNGYNIALDNGKLLFQTNGVKQYLSNVTIEPDRWQHIAVVFDNSNDAHFYLDGEFQQTVAGPSPATPNTDDPLFIGARTDVNGNVIQTFSGVIDELAVYGRSLTEAELFGIYLRELRWYRDTAVTYLTVDTDSPTIELLSDASYWPNGYIQLAVATTDATSGVGLLDFGLKAPGDSAFTWQGAPACAESSSRGGVWCPYFDSSQLSGEGAYELQFRAVDAVGNETTSPAYTLYVDATPPTVTGQPEYDGRLADLTATGELQWNLPLSGSLTDPNLTGTALAGSGVITNSVLVSLIDQAGGLISEQPQSAVVTGGNWSIDYRLDGNRPHGTYDIFITLEDEVGNRATVPVGNLTFDERPPSTNLDAWRLPASQTISQSLVLSGTVSELPSWGDNILLHHFEEAPGATVFYNAATSQYITATHSTCTACPTAGETGLFGRAVAFDGVDDFIDVPFVINPGVGAFTLSTWLNVADLSSSQTILQQLTGSGVSWLYVVQSNGKLQSNLGGVLGTTVRITPGGWHHAALTYDGAILSIYLDGRLAASARRSLGGSAGDMRIGINKGNAALFKGKLDEFALYDRALDASEIYALAQPVASGATAVEVAIVPQDFASETRARAAVSNWAGATLESSGERLTTWSYPLADDLEGYYNIHLRSRDGFDNQSRESVAWRGLIDVVSPTITVTAQHTWQGVSPMTDYSFTFSDFVLDASSYGQPCPAEELTAQTYNDANLPQNGLLYAASGSCRVAGHETSRTFTACDAVGHCTTETVTPAAATQYPLAVGWSGSGSGQIFSTPAGLDCTADCSALFDAGTVVTVTATADAGSTFVGWSGDGSGSTNPLTHTLTSHTAITATFTASRLSVFPAQPGVEPDNSVTISATLTPPQAGQTISFTIASGGGSLDLSSAVTDADGKASVLYTAPANPTQVQIDGMLAASPTITRSAYLYVGAATSAGRIALSASGVYTVGNLTDNGIQIIKTGDGAPILGWAVFNDNPCPASTPGDTLVSSYVDVMVEDTVGVDEIVVSMRYTDTVAASQYKPYWCNDGVWQPINAVLTVDGPNTTLVFTLTNSTSPTLLQLQGTPLVGTGISHPTSTSVEWFAAEALADRVRLSWQTLGELGLSGFSLYRGEDAVQPDTRITAHPLPAQGLDPILGYAYEYDDPTPVPPGTTLFYWLEELREDGPTVWHGPQVVEGRTELRIFLPVIGHATQSALQKTTLPPALYLPLIGQ